MRPNLRSRRLEKGPDRLAHVRREDGLEVLERGPAKHRIVGAEMTKGTLRRFAGKLDKDKQEHVVEGFPASLPQEFVHTGGPVRAADATRRLLLVQELRFAANRVVRLAAIDP